MTPAPPRADALYLVDGSGFIFRAFHALPMMTREDGTPVNAVYGFCAMLHKLLAELKAARVAVVFDAARRTFRHDIWPDYKAHRPPPPPELIPQFALIRDATRAFGVPALEAESYEADDLIAAYARAAEAQGLPVCIVSADKDMMQLIRPGVGMMDPIKNTLLGPDEVLAKFGVPPEKVVDVQALAGDSTDNVPGVPGIGIKTAAQLIQEYGDLDGVLAAAPGIKQPKRREALTQHAEQARISRRLATLDAQAPLPAPLDTLKVAPDHSADLRVFLQAQGFRSLLARMGGTPAAASPSSPPPPPVAAQPVPTPAPTAEAIPESPSYDCVQDRATLRRWVEEARAQGYVAVDTETTSLTPSTTRLVGLSLATAPGRACYVPLGHIHPDTVTDGFAFGDAKAPKQLAPADVVAELGPLLRDPSVLKIAHNLKFDSQVLESHGLAVAPPWDDTMLMSYALAEGGHGHGLDELALRHFQHKMIAFTDVAGTGKAQITFDRVPLDRATAYAAEDADFALRLWLLLRPLLAQRHASRVYERIERPLIPVIAAMERAGVRLDPAALRAQGHALGQRLQALETEIHALAGHPFNVGSPKQLGEVLFGELGLESGGKGKAGAWSTGHEVLEPLAEAGHAIVAKILEWRGFAKLKSTYTDALPEQIDPKTGRVHTSFSMVGATTGRLSSTDPNLQNIPIRTPDGRAIRRAFVAEEGWELLSVDYSQIELRLVADAANIAALIQAFQDGVDIHALTASQVFGIPLKEVPPERRRQAKAINFGIIYGISGFGLARQLGCPPSEASAFIRAYLDRFHELRDWIEATKETARAQGFVTTRFGRRVPIPGLTEKNGPRRAAAERQAINAPLQGTAADIMKRAMIRMPAALEEAGLKARMILQVHDELVFEVPVAELEPTTHLARRVMEQAPLPAVHLRVPLIAEAGHAPNWADAH